MPSAQLVLAAQANGKKSRGPKTPAGKRKSAANSRKHGLYSKTQLPNPAFQSDLDRFLAIFQSEYSPATQHEQDLVHVAAISLARERWAQRLSVKILNDHLKKDEARGIPITPARYFHATAANIKALNKLHVLENRFSKMWQSALDRLNAIRQDARTESRE